jgi:hypothetical protein
MALIGGLSLLLARALPERYRGIAGYLYFAVPIHFTIAQSISGRQRAAARIAALAARLRLDYGELRQPYHSVVSNLVARSVSSALTSGTARTSAVAAIILSAASPGNSSPN